MELADSQKVLDESGLQAHPQFSFGECARVIPKVVLLPRSRSSDQPCASLVPSTHQPARGSGHKGSWSLRTSGQDHSSGRSSSATTNSRQAGSWMLDTVGFGESKVSPREEI
jgi:hypothetical protein